ncbi:MAG TPA: thiamine pyrophosphate-dependent enzyme [Candidatus Omnitrophota bacterium]|nr:thiamine pyrophosphate-dependent enzyme [Candidatus Omnitrophota bacterium]
MKCAEALEILLKSIGKDAVCCFTNGFISRIAYLVKDRPNHFYMVGSMGLVSSVGLGIAMNSKRRVAVFDGDGSALMNLGALALIGNRKQSNLVHVILDNGCYASTGGQQTVSGTVDFVRLARASGYRTAVSIGDAKKLQRELSALSGARGPLLIHVRVEAEIVAPSTRVTVTPEQMAARVRSYLTTGARRRS